MSNDLKMKLPSKFDKININDLGELIWWAAHLGVGPEKLLSAINKVGNSVEDIRKYLETKV